MALSSRLAVIAGGFGGLAFATGLKLQAQGARLALLYAPFEADREAQVREAFAEQGTSDLDTYECDITSPESVEHAFEAISKSLNSGNAALAPSILVNSAGYVTLNPLETTPPAETLKHLHVNVLGPMLVSQAFARLYFDSVARFKPQGDRTSHPPGRIVNIASQAAHVALDQHGPYCASKSALIGLTRCMANEWGSRGIVSNSVSPGPVMTELGKKAWKDDEVRERYLARVPVGRFGEPDEIADAVVFLCSDQAATINGTDIRLDGGFTAK